MNQQRPVVSSQQTASTRRPIVSPKSGTTVKIPQTIVPLRSVPAPQVPVVSRQKATPARAPIAPRKPSDHASHVHDERHEPPAPPRVKLGDVIGDQLHVIARELQEKKRRCRAIQLEEIIHSGVCFFASATEGHNSKPRRIEVGYKRATKPARLKGFSESELAVPCPRIDYPEHGYQGPIAFREILDERYATDFAVGDQEVRVLDTGMFVMMCRENDRMVYRPCDKDLNTIDFPIVGKFSGYIREFALAMELPQLRAQDSTGYIGTWSDEIVEPLLMISFDGDAGNPCGFIIVKDKASRVLCIDLDLPKEEQSA